MGVNLIRKNSDIPNIRNYDDSRLFRYATYGKSGIIKDYGEELAMTASGYTILHIGTGEIVHQGWQVEINAGGVDIELENRDNIEYYSVYLEINLSVTSQQKAEIKYLKGNEDYPSIDPGDDLTATPSGTSRVLIARIYLVKNTSVSINRVINVLPYTLQTNKGSATIPVYLDSEGNLQPITSYEGISQYANYASADTSKGTIEERLTRLGFRYPPLSLTFNFAYGGYSVCNLSMAGGSQYSGSSREGNRVILQFNFSISSGGSSGGITGFLQSVTSISASATIPALFRPKSQQVFYLPTGIITYKAPTGDEAYSRFKSYLKVTINTDGTITLTNEYVSSVIFSSIIGVDGSYGQIKIGYEAYPIIS